MILKEVNEKRWLPVQLSKHGSCLSHLFFTDDVLLFAKATVSQARLIGEVLEIFFGISGLKVSLQKSVIFALKGVPNSKKDKITGVTEIKFTSNLEKYLGYRLRNGRVTK